MKLIASPRRHLQPVARFLTAAGVAAVLTACGGGDGATSPTVSPPWTPYLGDYSTACLPSHSLDGFYKIAGTLAFDATGKYTAVVHLTTHSSANCEVGSTTSEVHAGFDLKALDGVKTITSLDGSRPSGTANKLEATLTNVLVKKGQLSGSIPTPGMTLTVGYRLGEKSIYFVSGTREADGLGKVFARTVLTKLDPPPPPVPPASSGS